MTEVERMIKAAMARRRNKAKRFPRPANPDRVERDYRRELEQMLRTIQNEVERQLFGRLKNLAEDFYRFRPDLVRQDADFPPSEHLDAANDDVVKIISDVRVKVAERYSDEQIKRIARRKGIKVAEFNQEALAKGFKRVAAVDIWLSQPWLTQEIEMFSISNAALITSLRDQTMDRVQTTVLQGFRSGKRWEVIRDQIQKDIDPRKGPMRSRANLIARDQVSKLNGQLTSLRQTELGIKRYIWRTSLDERVRPSHQVLEGKIFSWDDPPEVGHPGEDYQCRCVAEPYLADVIGERE